MPAKTRLHIHTLYVSSGCLLGWHCTLHSTWYPDPNFEEHRINIHQPQYLACTVMTTALLASPHEELPLICQLLGSSPAQLGQSMALSVQSALICCLEHAIDFVVCTHLLLRQGVTVMVCTHLLVRACY